ncbi:DUF2071 domain-containing protein [Chloroflexota bacterium]
MSRSDIGVFHKSILSRLLCVKMTLRDVIYISYALPARTLQPLVPSFLRLATVEGDIAFISLVVLRSTQVRLSAFPLLKFNYNQFNIRTYVTDPVSGQFAVYFIRSGVTSRFISLATSTIGIPWQFIELRTDANMPNGLQFLSVCGNWEGPFSVRIQANANVSMAPSFFEDRRSVVDFIIRPLVGFAGDDRRLSRFTIHHPEVQPQSWSLLELDCPLFQKLVTIEDLRRPHSIFYLPTADFSIFLPPKRIKKEGEI